MVVAAPSLIYFFGSSKFTIFPHSEDLIIDPESGSEMSFPLVGMLEGMHQFCLHMPPLVKRRPVHVTITDEAGNKTAELNVDECTALRSHRDILFEEPVLDSKGTTYRVHLIFEDGPVLLDGHVKDEVFAGFALTTYYDLSLSEVKTKFRSFKPLQHPILFTCLVFMLYIILTAYLLSSLRKEARS